MHCCVDACGGLGESLAHLEDSQGSIDFDEKNAWRGYAGCVNPATPIRRGKWIELVDWRDFKVRVVLNHHRDRYVRDRLIVFGSSLCSDDSTISGNAPFLDREMVMGYFA